MAAAKSVKTVVQPRAAHRYAKKIESGKDTGLYDIGDFPCLCFFAQGPCGLHPEGRSEIERPQLWDLLSP